MVVVTLMTWMVVGLCLVISLPTVATELMTDMANTRNTEPVVALTWLPERILYPESIADPSRPVLAAQFMYLPESDIQRTGVQRYYTRAGGRFALVQYNTSSSPRRSWQLGIEAGVISQFDIEHSTDNIGWDGVFRLTAALQYHDDLHYKFGLQHVSSHIGDEYMADTGRQRIEYTRGEWLAGVSWRFTGNWRSYAELGWGHVLRADQLQEPWRIEAGLEFQERLSRGHQIIGWPLAWYTALDLSATEERDWAVNRTLQVGIELHQPLRTWRIGLEYYRGRSLLGEFFQQDESYLSLGLWLSL